MANWYLKVGDKELGPGSEQQLRSAYKKGAIREDSLVRREDSADWVTLKNSGVIDQTADNPFIEKGHASQLPRDSSRNSPSKPAFHANMFQEKPRFKVGGQLKYATFVDRFMAIFIDCIIMMLACGFVSFVPFFGWMVQIVIGFAYFVMLQSEWGYTIGRKVMGMYVALENGAKPELKDYVVRYFSAIVSGIFFLVGYFIALGDDRMRTFHDRLAGTVVVKDGLTRSL